MTKKTPQSLRSYVNKHLDETIVVLGTGPSSWGFAQELEPRSLIRKLTSVGINRAYELGLDINYQISLDRIWTALLKRPDAQANYQSLVTCFNSWRAKHNVADWSLEDFVYAYKDELGTIHEEVWRYLRLLSKHAPFTRVASATCSNAAPYECVSFGGSDNKPVRGKFNNGLMVHANTAHTAIHLALVLGAKQILLCGVDMSKPDPRARIWERSSLYYRERVKVGFKILADRKGPVKIINLNPDACLKELPKVSSKAEAVQLLREAVDEQERRVGTGG